MTSSITIHAEEIIAVFQGNEAFSFTGRDGAEEDYSFGKHQNSDILIYAASFNTKIGIKMPKSNQKRFHEHITPLFIS